MKKPEIFIIIFLVLIFIVLCIALSKPIQAREKPWTNEEVIMLAKTVWGEAQGLDEYEQSMVVWCILNRLDSGEFQPTIYKIITAVNPVQFEGYSPTFPVEESILRLCEDVLDRWWNNKDGRTLPLEFVYFHGDGRHNYYSDGNGYTYDFSLPNPYIIKEEEICQEKIPTRNPQKKLLQDCN